MGKNDLIRLENGINFLRIQNRQRSFNSNKSWEAHDEKSKAN